MKILVAPDTFKDSLDAISVCQAIEQGIRRYNPNFEVIEMPLADGGEGTAQILSHSTQGRMRQVQVHDPLMRPIRASYGVDAAGHTAFIEMAAASGLQLLAPSERKVMHTTSYGTGELILDALMRGAKHIVLGIGGSATHDGGMGMAQALGYRFLGNEGQALPGTGYSLTQVCKIDRSQVSAKLDEICVEVACDVDNPLYGPQGAAYVYAAQKGASPSEIQLLDQGLVHFNHHLTAYLGHNIAETPGAGAAGGMGAGAIAFLQASLVPGIHLVMKLLDFEKRVKEAQFIITGEGKIDSQTLHGKVVNGVCFLAKKHKIPVAALCGTMDISISEMEKLGLCYVNSLLDRPMSLAQALEAPGSKLTFAAYNAMRLFCSAPL